MQQSAVRLSERNGLTVSVETVSPTLPALPAAVEVAAYRIVTEALNNTLRHAAATHAVVRLGASDDVIEVDVVDDGVGLQDTSRGQHTSGVGLSAMAERAAEVGGRFEAYAPPGGGTAVRAVLPTRPAA
ncbi:MAG: ATP-binding protein [Actinomycetota bacterium]|nr:ATP-binding protein [Actinomycetota bacterium]